MKKGTNNQRMRGMFKLNRRHLQLIKIFTIKALGISSSAIRQALVGKTKKCKGYVFRYTTNEL